VTHAAGYVAVGIVGLWYFLRDHFSVREALIDHAATVPQPPQAAGAGEPPR
jgi:hypothetical protein